ncbi:hypothetical protein AB4232_12255 [Vibrio sp. 10N.286.46.A8]|uniref:hypothetical protein n=1 Tax=Vibrio sp. 10N.286.46.A8 TaxID=3229697 RepID=UPI003550A16F
MITFTTESIESICNLLRHETFPNKTTYQLNDGIHLRTVSNFIADEQHFEVNGMSSSVIVGYKLQLKSGEDIYLQLKDDKLILKETKIPAKSNQDYGIDGAVSDFMF